MENKSIKNTIGNNLQLNHLIKLTTLLTADSLAKMSNEN